jgi:DHA2 family multidrug resistance protein
VQPLSMVIMFRVFPAHQRGRAMGLFGMGVVLAPALGPALGGLLVDFYNWRAVFVAAVPVSSTGMLLAMLFMPQREGSGPRPGFDWIGLILMCLFIGNLLLGLSNGQRAGWESFQISSNFAIAILSAAAFVWWELKVEQPMFNLRIFASGGFTAAALVTVVFGSMLFGSTYLVPLFVQTVQGYTATRAGVLMIPAGLAMMAIFPLAGRLSDRGISPQLPILAGMLVFSFATYLMVAGDTNTPFLTFAFWLLLSRIGLSMVMPNLTVSAMRALTPEMVSQGSGALNFMRQLGGAFGVNLLAINLERQTEQYRAYFRASQTPENWMTDDLIREISRLFAEIGLPPLPSLATSFQFIESTILEQANMMAFRDDFLIVSLVSLAAIVPALFIGRTWRAKPAPHAPAAP